MSIREAKPNDIPAISKLAKETYIATFGQTMSQEELIEALKTRSEEYFTDVIRTDTILVAEEEKIVGFMQIGRVTITSVQASGRDLELIKIYIDENQQGKGIGKALMEVMLKHPRLNGIENIYLDVYDENKKAIGLYKKYGFKIIGKTPFKINNKIVGYDLLMKYTNNKF